MDLGLKGRVALVTGSSRGLGKAIAEALAQEGASVIINGRNSAAVGNTAFEIGCKSSVYPHQFVCDVTNTKRIKELFDEKISKLDILVNNAGNLERFGSFEDLTEEDWQRSFDVTFMSAVRFINASLPYLRKSDQARIINISSLTAHEPGNFNPHYGIAKSGLLNLTKYLSKYLGKDKILVNAICPSTLAGGGWDENIKDRAKRDGITPEKAEKIMRQEENKKSPLGIMGELSNVADLVVYLASSRANFLTGHCYNVDGGITRSV